MIISTSAKVILSGEHSVVYGAPALGSPLGLFLHSTWAPLPGSHAVFLRFRDRHVEAAPSWAALADKLSIYRGRYALFRRGEAEIKSVLPEWHDLAALTFGAFHEKFGGEMPGVSVALETEIPISSGLGSSSSLILNLLQGLLKLTDRSMPETELLEFARSIEDFQHGYSSGLDLALVSARQPLVFVKGRGIIESMPRPAASLMLIQSGVPVVSTGECVAHVRERFANDTALWNDFSACTRGIQEAFTDADAANLRDGVMRNHDLLSRIGVVPEKVQSFIAHCRLHNIAAKICGAGAVAGEAAGMIWALAGNDDDRNTVAGIAREYGYGHGLYSIAG